MTDSEWVERIVAEMGEERGWNVGWDQVKFWRMRRVLFICSRNRLRSPTAEEIFRNEPGLEVDSAGLNPDAEVVLTEEQVEWADLILVMETIHRTRLTRRFGKQLKGKRVVVLGIPDEYDYLDEDLIRILRQKCRPHFA